MNLDRLQIEVLPTDLVRPYHSNARTHSDEQVAQIAASMQEFGFTNPILIDRANVVIAGHGRLSAAISLGYREVPCLRLNELDDLMEISSEGPGGDEDEETFSLTITSKDEAEIIALRQIFGVKKNATKVGAKKVFALLPV